MRSFISALLISFSITLSTFAVEVDRYGLTNTHQLKVDNYGHGFDELYGLRNFRVVLADTLYRGGGNNVYNSVTPRPNMNPLPDNGLEALCEEGFDTAVYMYSENFNTAPHLVNCKHRYTGKPHQLRYKQISPFEENGTPKLLQIVHERIQAKARGDNASAYFHCWNGWHASGYISALALRQFCGMGGDAAADYWELNTDGRDLTVVVETKIKNLIRNFKPIAEFKISPEQREAICYSQD